MKKIISLILSAVFILCVFSSCGEEIANSQNILIVCSTFPQYDFAENIVGDKAEVTLLDSASDIHSFEPTVRDIALLSKADLFVYIGGESDSWVDKAIKSSGNENLAMLKLIECVNQVNEEKVEGMQGEQEEEPEADEHIWLSLKNAQKMVNAICDKLCKIDFANSEYYKSNSASYVKQLSELDKAYEKTVNSSERKVLLFADRFPFRYLVEDYGLKYYAAFSGCSAETNASFETVAFLIEKVNELSLPLVLVTESSDGSIAKTVCDETGAKQAVLNSCQSVHKKQIDEGASYIEIMKNNLSVIGEALN